MIYEYILLLIYIIIQSVIVGTISAVVGRTITNYEGPFNLFPRVQRWLLPDPFDTFGEVYDPDTLFDLLENLPDYQMRTQEHLSKIQAWELHFQDSPSFKKTLRGTMWAILTCVFCIGPYLTFLLAALLSWYLRSAISMFLFVWGLSFSIHYFINKKLERCYDS